MIPPAPSALAPVDPFRPFQDQGGGFHRVGPTIYGPDGASHALVGSSILRSDGRVCHAVGTSLVCP
jgi:hypothetical protein